MPTSRKQRSGITRRAIDIHEDGENNERALKALTRRRSSAADVHRGYELRTGRCAHARCER